MLVHPQHGGPRQLLHAGHRHGRVERLEQRLEDQPQDPELPALARPKVHVLVVQLVDASALLAGDGRPVGRQHRVQVVDGAVQGVALLAQHFHFLVDRRAFGAQLPDVLGALLEHGGFAELGVGVLLELGDERVEHVEAVLDVVASFLFGVNVADASLGGVERHRRAGGGGGGDGETGG